MDIRGLFSAFLYPPMINLSEQFNYGHREILLVNNRLPQNCIFKASIQHGWYHGLENPRKVRNRFFQAYPELYWNQRVVEHKASLGFQQAYAIGSPWSHLLQFVGIELNDSRLIRELNFAEEPNSTLYFPTHSFHGIKSYLNADIRHVREITNSKQVVVCLFWIDFIDPFIRKAYQAQDCEVICVGYRGSSGFEIPWAPVGGRLLFLPNLLETILRYKNIVVQDVGTAFWYALSLRKNVFLLDNSEKQDSWYTIEGSVGTKNNLELAQSTMKDFPDFQLNERIELTEELNAFVLSEIGWYEALNSRGVLTNKSILLETAIDPQITSSLESTMIQMKSSLNATKLIRP